MKTSKRCGPGTIIPPTLFDIVDRVQKNLGNGDVLTSDTFKMLMYDEKQKPYLNHLLNREALKAMNIWLSLIRFLPGDSVDLQVARNKWRKAKVFWIDFETVREFVLLRD